MNSAAPGQLIDGKVTAAQVLAEVTADVATLKTQGIEPALAVVLVGNDPASHVYVRNKVLRAGEAGIRSQEYRLPAEASAAEVLALVAELNRDASVHETGRGATRGRSASPDTGAKVPTREHGSHQ